MALQDDGAAAGGVSETEAPIINNTPGNRKKIKSAAKRINELRNEREALNADIQAELEACKVTGVPKSILKHAIKLSLLDREKLDQHDEAMHMCREALGIPVQEALFK